MDLDKVNRDQLAALHINLGETPYPLLLLSDDEAHFERPSKYATASELVVILLLTTFFDGGHDTADG
jgi:hypothetical protein